MIRKLVNDLIYVYGFSLIYVIIFNTQEGLPWMSRKRNPFDGRLRLQRLRPFSNERFFQFKTKFYQRFPINALHSALVECFQSN